MSVISIPLRFAAGFDSKHRCEAQTRRGTRCNRVARGTIWETGKRRSRWRDTCRQHYCDGTPYGWWAS
jgi:hypothetical protein